MPRSDVPSPADDQISLEKSTPVISDNNAQLDADALIALERICVSSSFQKARVLRDLLLYLWKSRNTDLTEHQLGTEILGRRSDFDPKTDATVRVHIARLRQRLQSYYDSEGKDDTIRFSIPVGVHRLSITRSENAVEIIPAEIISSTAPPPHTNWRNIAILALIACFGLALHDYWTWQKLQHITPELHPFWSETLQCQKSYSIIVPSPQFFRWRKEGFVARDFAVNSHDQISASLPLQTLRQQWGEPETTRLYTVTADTLASGEIARYLQDRGVSVDIFTKSTVSQNLIEEQNSILLFGSANIGQYEPFIQPLSFRYENNRLVNLKPQPGEESEWRGQSNAQDHSISYGLMASLPSRTGMTRQLLLVNASNSSFLVANPSLHALRQFWGHNHKPDFFEMVIRFETREGTTLRVEPVAIHPWQGSTPFITTH